MLPLSMARPAAITAPPRAGALLVVLVVLALHGCGPSAGGGGANAAGTPQSPGRGVPVKGSRTLEGATVYDADGRPQACAKPVDTCPEAAPDVRFLDRCRLGGYQVRRCGCTDRCSGDVSSAKRHFDATGAVKDCEPAKLDCDPPPAPAQFQDACSERGFRLAQCGCEWLCSGNVAK